MGNNTSDRISLSGDGRWASTRRAAAYSVAPAQGPRLYILTGRLRSTSITQPWAMSTPGASATRLVSTSTPTARVAIAVPGATGGSTPSPTTTIERTASVIAS